MSQKIKDALGVAIIISIVVVAYSAFIYSTYYSKSIEPSSFRSFTVSAQGKTTAVPDVAEFTFSVITQGGENLAELQKENTEKSNKIIEYIKANKIDPKDIKTQNYNIDPRYQYYNCDNRILKTESIPCPPPEIVGYTISQTVQIKIRDFSKIGDLLSGTVSNGANSVSQITFTIDDPTQVETIARNDAIKKAKEKAETIAKEGGFKLGRLLSIDEGYYQPAYEFSAKSAAIGMGGGTNIPAPIIEPGTQEMTVNITLRYEID